MRYKIEYRKKWDKKTNIEKDEIKLKKDEV
jgi:hypothetical protein